MGMWLREMSLLGPFLQQNFKSMLKSYFPTLVKFVNAIITFMMSFLVIVSFALGPACNE